MKFCKNRSVRALLRSFAHSYQWRALPRRRDVEADRDRRVEGAARDTAGREAARNDDEADGQAEVLALLPSEEKSPFPFFIFQRQRHF